MHRDLIDQDEYMKDMVKNGSLRFSLACRDNELGLAKELNEKIPEVINIEKCYHPFHLAAQAGHYDIVKYFLEQGFDPTELYSDRTGREINAIDKLNEYKDSPAPGFKERIPLMVNFLRRYVFLKQQQEVDKKTKLKKYIIDMFNSTKKYLLTIFKK